MLAGPGLRELEQELQVEYDVHDVLFARRQLRELWRRLRWIAQLRHLLARSNLRQHGQAVQDVLANVRSAPVWDVRHRHVRSRDLQLRTGLHAA